jgi:hypothetical protein
MPGSTFLIEELNLLGGAQPPGGFQRFEWSEQRQSIPTRPWSWGVHQRTVRTDYPGADDPTEQVLGPNFTPFTVEGVWDDRYNPIQTGVEFVDGERTGFLDPGGYAVDEWRRFEAMVRRGNVVRITFEAVVIQGVITDFEVDYHHGNRIGYRFTFSPHHRQPGGFFAIRRSPRTVLNASQLRDEVSTELAEAFALHERAPSTMLVTSLFLDADALMTTWADDLAMIDTAIEQRRLTPEVEPTAALLRIASLFYGMSTTGQALLALLYQTDADEALTYESGDGALLYNLWARGVMYQARRVALVSRRAASELQQRAEPNAIALYRPQEGEHLYEIANRFYRTKSSWRHIAKRNGLVSFTLEGTELLIIPEVNER